MTLHSATGLTLFGYWRSSATWRVRIGLHLLEVDFEYTPVHLVLDGGQQNSPAHTARNPLAQVPVLTWTSSGVAHRLTQSLAILEYLDEVNPSRLLPSEPFARARARQLAEMVNAGIQPLQNLWLMRQVSDGGGDGRALARNAIERGLTAIQREVQLASALPMGARPAGYLVGNRPSLADICLIPQLYNARRFGIDVGQFPDLLAVEAVCSEHPAFRLAHPDAQPDAVPPTA